MSRIHPDFIKEVLALVSARGVEATWEHPGYIEVKLGTPGDEYLAIGDANGPWNVDVMKADGDVIAYDGALEMSARATAIEVANLIVAARQKWAEDVGDTRGPVTDEERSNGPRRGGAR